MGDGRKALVLRWGAFGDAIQVTPVFRLLHNDGYEVIFHTMKQGEQVTRHNPYISKWIVWNKEKKWDYLTWYWKNLALEYGEPHRFINLTGTSENTLILHPGQAEYKWPKELRHAQCNLNYWDAALHNSGYRHLFGLKGELYFTPDEDRATVKYLKDARIWDKFVVLWSLSGSAHHKVYPWAEYVAKKFLDRHKDVAIITVGDNACKVLEWEHPRTVCESGAMKWRMAMSLTRMVDCVIGAETGILSAAGCYPTPKVLMLSHSTEENLSKYWKNCISLTPNLFLAPCYPCHQLHYQRQGCLIESERFGSGAPVCTVYTVPQDVDDALEAQYQKFKDTRRR